MGRPMALNLLRAGFDVAVWARRPETAAPLVQSGAKLLPSPIALAAESDIVFLCLTADADVEQIALGVAQQEGLIQGVRKGTVIVDHSTISADLTRRLHEQFLDKGANWLDAPVSGGNKGATAGTLAIMVGGEATALDKVRPLLNVLGKTIVHMGGSGAGQVTKACNQMFLLANIEAVAEAAQLARAHGLDFATLRQALLAGSGASVALEVFGDRMAQRNFAPGVEARLHHKDFAIIMDTAAHSGCPLPLSAVVWQQLNALMAAGYSREDSASLLRVLEKS